MSKLSKKFTSKCASMNKRGAMVVPDVIYVSTTAISAWQASGDIQHANLAREAVSRVAGVDAARTVFANVIPHKTESQTVDGVTYEQYVGKADKAHAERLRTDGKAMELLTRNIERWVAKRQGRVDAALQAEWTLDSKAKAWAKACVKHEVAKAKAIKAFTAALDAEYLKAVDKKAA